MYGRVAGGDTAEHVLPTRPVAGAISGRDAPSKLESNHTMTAPSASSGAATPALPVPPAQVHFPPEDRAEILRRIDEALARRDSSRSERSAASSRSASRAHHGAKHAVAVNSGTSAIEIPLRALAALGQPVDGRDVLVPANTFFATAAAVVAAGARPKFVDCDPATMAVDPGDVASAIGPDTVGLVVVHIGGLVTPAIHELRRLCDERGIFLFEDAAHAHGSSLGDRMAGTFGVAGSFSFYPTKVMAGGEGGIILTDDDTIADEARIYRDQGKASFTANVHTHLGYNWRMSEPHAAIALSQLGRLDEFIAHRQRIAKIYDDGLAAASAHAARHPGQTRCATTTSTSPSCRTASTAPSSSS